MKKIFFSLSVFAVVLFAAQSCTKNSNIESPSVESSDYEQVDNSTISEEEFEMQEDPIGYEPEAVTVTVTGGTLVSNTDADGKCTAWDNKPTFLKSIKINATKVTLNLAFDKNVNIQSIKNENTKTGTGDLTGTNGVGQRITFSDVAMGADSMHWTVKIAASDTFRLGSAKMQIKYTELNTKLVPTAKVKNVTVYCMGSNTNGVFGSQKWGYAYEGGNLTKYTGTPATISLDSANHWKPTVGDVICFGASSAQKATILTADAPVVPTTTASKLKGPKYKFTYVIWNTTCKGSRSKRTGTVYGRTQNAVKPSAASTDVITGYIR